MICNKNSVSCINMYAHKLISLIFYKISRTNTLMNISITDSNSLLNNLSMMI